MFLPAANDEYDPKERIERARIRLHAELEWLECELLAGTELTLSELFALNINDDAADYFKTLRAHILGDAFPVLAVAVIEMCRAYAEIVYGRSGNFLELVEKDRIREHVGREAGAQRKYLFHKN